MYLQVKGGWTKGYELPCRYFKGDTLVGLKSTDFRIQ